MSLVWILEPTRWKMCLVPLSKALYPNCTCKSLWIRAASKCKKIFAVNCFKSHCLQSEGPAISSACAWQIPNRWLLSCDCQWKAEAQPGILDFEILQSRENIVLKANGCCCKERTMKILSFSYQNSQLNFVNSVAYHIGTCGEHRPGECTHSLFIIVGSLALEMFCCWTIISSSRLDGCHILFVSPLLIRLLYRSNCISFIDMFVSGSTTL